MQRRFTEAEKGKGPVPNTYEVPVKRIKAPSLDTAALIKENALTLIGRLMNPQEQKIRTLLPSLPRKWNIQGRAVGSDLGHNYFQFRFENEEDLQKVLDNRAYHFGYWMIILQCWEPVISDSFPSVIPFWIRIKGLPFHYWQEPMLYNIGKELGFVEKHELTTTSARIRVQIDGLKLLIKDTIIEFESGEESKITLEYERRENLCSICLRLSHLSSHCPSNRSRTVPLEAPSAHPRGSLRSQDRVSESPHPAPETVDPRSQFEQRDSFYQRVDRHGRSFGPRLSTKQTKNPLLSNTSKK